MPFDDEMNSELSPRLSVTQLHICSRPGVSYFDILLCKPVFIIVAGYELTSILFLANISVAVLDIYDRVGGHCGGRLCLLYPEILVPLPIWIFCIFLIIWKFPKRKPFYYFIIHA